jgi:hypothetical protein
LTDAIFRHNPAAMDSNNYYVGVAMPSSVDRQQQAELISQCAGIGWIQVPAGEEPGHFLLHKVATTPQEREAAFGELLTISIIVENSGGRAFPVKDSSPIPVAQKWGFSLWEFLMARAIRA